MQSHDALAADGTVAPWWRGPDAGFRARNRGAGP